MYSYGGGQQLLMYGYAQKLQGRVDLVTEKLDRVTAEIEIMKAEREAREARKLQQQKRQKQEDKDPILLEHYEALLSFVGTEMTINQARRSLAFALIFVTGMRIGGFQASRFEYIKSIFASQRPAVRLRTLKRGPFRTAHLSGQGRKVIKSRQADYMFILEYQGGDMNSLVFPNQKKENETMSRSHGLRSNQLVATGTLPGTTFRQEGA